MSVQTIAFRSRAGVETIRKNKVVHLQYALFDQHNNRCIERQDDLLYLHGGYGGTFPKIEQILDGQRTGTQHELLLSADDAYGPYLDDLVIEEPDDSFPPEARHVGAQLEGKGSDGDSIAFTVTAIDDGTITLDGNHPLAGRDIRCVCKVKDVRDATKEELHKKHPISRKLSA